MRTTTPARVDPPATKTPASIQPATDPAYITAILDVDGRVMIGTIKLLNGAAVAHDGKKTVAMLRPKPNEPAEELLQRLNTAIGVAKRAGCCIDEINDPSSERHLLGLITTALPLSMRPRSVTLGRLRTFSS